MDMAEEVNNLDEEEGDPEPPKPAPNSPPQEGRAHQESQEYGFKLSSQAK